VIESYVIGFICCLINVRVIDFTREEKWTFANTVLTLIVLSILVLFPIISVRYMFKNFANLEANQIKKRYGELYAGYNIKDKWILLHWEIEYLRKIALACCVVITTD